MVKDGIISTVANGTDGLHRPFISLFSDENRSALQAERLTGFRPIRASRTRAPFLRIIILNRNSKGTGFWRLQLVANPQVTKIHVSVFPPENKVLQDFFHLKTSF